jgi:hypothetical protein
VTSAAGRLFYRRLASGDRVSSLVVREGSAERVLVDPMAGSTEVAAINNYSVSPDGSLVAVHVAKGGGEWARCASSRSPPAGSAATPSARSGANSP